MEQITYYVCDQNNGRFASYETIEKVKAAYERWLAHGIAAEKELQDETGYTDDEIEARVRNFYNIEKETLSYDYETGQVTMRSEEIV